MESGKIIVIDGLDGSGKSTQLEAVGKIFKNSGKDIRMISFPDYNSPSSAAVKMYLNGEISQNLEDINVYAASSFYAVDRYISYKRSWENDYKNGKVILSGRYTTSNCIHQMSKLPEGDWDSYIEWLFDYEYQKLGIPKHNICIFLDIDPLCARELLLERYNGDKNKLDIHEKNIKYMELCRKSALYAAKKLRWKRIAVSDKENIFPKEYITKKIIEVLNQEL